MREVQKVFHIYTGNVYEGVYTCTGAELAASPYRAGPPPTRGENMARKHKGIVVSRFQLKSALKDSGLLDMANDAILNSRNPRTKMAWSELNEFRRNSLIVEEVQAALFLKDDEMDTIFEVASAIEV